MAKKGIRSDRRDHAAIAIGYARDVCEGTVPGGRLLRLRCQTFLDEIERDWEFTFDHDRANRACRFMELLPVPDGKEGQRVGLRPWQSFVIANIFGWIRRDTGLRRFTQAHIWVGAGNGKSFMGSAIGLYMAFGEGQRAAEVACAAAAKKQAEIVFDTAKQMMQFDPQLCELLGVEVWAHALVQGKSGSKFEPRSSEAKTLAGMRPYCVIVDELHVVDAAVYAFLTNRLAKRDQTLLLTISTAGYDTSSVGFTIFEESRKVIEGGIEAPEVFAIIYQADSSERLEDEAEWAKAHPNLDFTVRRNIVRTKAREASQFSHFRYQFVTEQLNRWASARAAWMPMDRWAACTVGTRLEDFKGKPAWIGLDVSLGRSDFTAKAYVFREDREEKRHYVVFFRLYLPEETFQRDFARYSQWQDRITVQPGDTTDFTQVEEELIRDMQDFPGSTICYDPAFAAMLAQRLEAKGYLPIEVKQTTASLNLAMHEVMDAVMSGRLRHDGNPAAAWQMGNVTVRPNAGGMIRTDKSSPDAKVDIPSALFTAMQQAMLGEAAGEFWFRFVEDGPAARERTVADPWADEEEGMLLL